MALLEVENLSIGYHTQKGYLHAVEDVSFLLESGKSLGFVGESGCGKTTLGMALMRLLPPNGVIREGRILFDGEDLLKKSDEEMREVRWEKIAMIFQAAMNALNPVHRVHEQIAEAILTHDPSLDRKKAYEQVEGLFQFVEIPKDRMRDFPHQYSGGMKQRAIIAMALACNPAILIADEPTTNLDVITQKKIMDLLRALKERLGLSIIYISHDLALILRTCKRVAVLHNGKVIESGRAIDVSNHPNHPYTRRLINSIPRIKKDGQH